MRSFLLFSTSASIIASHLILDNRLLKMNTDQRVTQDGNEQSDGLITTNQILIERRQLQAKKKKKCHGNRREQQRRRRLRKREQRHQEQLEPMDQDDQSPDEQVQVSCPFGFTVRVILFVQNFRH